MRQLTTLPSAEAARTLADYLLTQSIDTKVERESDGWAIWVRDEDKLQRARQELEAFQQSPEDPRFKAAVDGANSIRRQKNQEEKAYHRRQQRFAARMSSGAADTITIGLIVASVLVNVLSRGGDPTSTLVQALLISPYKEVPVRVAQDDEDEESVPVVLQTPGLQPILDGQIWRLVTPIFIHFTFVHLLFDMYMLYKFGDAFERRRGRLRYVFFVLVVAIVSNLTQYFLGHPQLDSSPPRLILLPTFGGMSGVVYGLFGYIWMKARFQPELGLGMHPNTVIFLMAWFVLCMTPWIRVVIGSGVANGAHAGGLIAGMLIGYVPTLWSSGRSD